MVYPHLDKIECVDDVKKLSINELQNLSQELRQRIIEVLSKNGGHLSSNLGVVELTLAMHKVFNSPRDKFIWDTSHQTYTHKLLTDRKARFSSINRDGGICGFSDPRESPHDHFFAGHAGTALSLSVGMSKMRDLTDDDFYVVPVIGDAALTCGLTYEAMNNLSRKMKKFVVILNDNKMSISQNVGRVNHILSRLLSNPTSHRLHQELDALVSKIPSLGDILSKQGQKITESLKNLVSPAAFFEHFGLSYIGPIDGHDIKRLIDVFEGIKDSNWPVLVHVLTNKGLGMEEAEKNPTPYHGAKPFNRETGKFLPATSTKPTFPKIFGKQILKMAERDPTVVAVTPAMSAGSCLDPFMERYPDRCIDVGIAESHSVTYSGGMAYKGKLKVVACVYATFLQRALDNVFHDVCLQKLPVLFALDRAGLAPYGPTHHGVFDISFLKAMPNLVITQPRNGQVLIELMESAFSWNRPVVIRYPNQATEVDEEAPLQIRKMGRGEVLAKGKGLLLIGLGEMNLRALEVREKLKEYGIEATVFDPIFVKPLDSDQLCDLLTTHNTLVTIEEHSVTTGLGATINHFLLSNGYQNIQVTNFGIPEAYIEHGSLQQLHKSIGLDRDSMVNEILTKYRERLNPSVQKSKELV